MLKKRRLNRQLRTLNRRLSAERKRRRVLEKAVAERNEYYRRLIESAPLAIAIYDNNQFLFSNKAHRKIMGASHSSELIGRKVLDVITEDCHELFKQRQKDVMEKGAETPLIVYKCRRLDGAVIEVETIAIPFIYKGKKVIMGLAKDVTRQKMAERKLRRQRDQLIQADKLASLGIVTSGVAHEINNPNHFIMMNAFMLSRIWEDLIPFLDKIQLEKGTFSIGRMRYSQVREKIKELCAGITDGSERIRKIIKELKAFSRPEAPMVDEMVNLNAVVEAACSLLSNLLRKSTHNFSFHPDPVIPDVRGNFQRLEQVIVNLLVNACQALQNKEDAIMVSTGYDPVGEKVILRVRDEGIGIPAENLSRITDPFFTTKRDLGGTGLGLSVSSRIIADHGAELVYHSEPGVETVATITLPAPSPEKNRPIYECGEGSQKT